MNTKTPNRAVTSTKVEKFSSMSQENCGTHLVFRHRTTKKGYVL